MSKNKSMGYQVKTILGSKQCYGRSKHSDKALSNNYHPYGIYSVKTYEDYTRLCTQFCSWAKAEHGCKTVEDCREHINEYMELYGKTKSAYSQHTMKYAIQKLYDAIQPGFKVDYQTPKRVRSGITKNRTDISEIRDFDEKKHDFVLSFGCATGLRRHELLNLRYSDIRHDPETDRFTVHVFKGKGGKVRDVPVLPEHNDIIRSVYERSRSDETIFHKQKNSDGKDPQLMIPSRMPEHHCRRMYAQELYKATERINIPREGKYICRKDKAGTVYDREAMQIVSEALGHHRIDVIAGHYLE